MLSSGTLRSGWRRGAVLCLLLWTTSAPAVGTKTATSDTAGAEAALAKMRDAKNECNTKRKEQEAAFMKVIQPNALHGGLTFDQLKDPKTGKETSFDEIKTELKTMLTKEKAVEAAQKKMEELKAKIDPSSPFEKVMAEAGLEIKTAEKINALKEIPGIGSIRNVRKAAENLKEGEISRAFTTANGAIILKVVKVWPIDEKKFEQEKETFEKEALREKTAGAMTSLIEDLRKKLNVNLETMKKLFSDGPQ